MQPNTREISPDSEGQLATVERILRPFGRRHRLSSREQQVLLLACAGRISKETAERLSCSRHTIDEYWSRIFRKTGCRTQTAVLAKVLREEARSILGASVGTCIERQV